MQTVRTRGESYERLVSAHRRALERMALRLSRNREDAQDLLQETLLDAYRAFGSYRQDGRFFTWCARIMTNNHLDRLRRRRIQPLSLDQPLFEDEAEPFEVPDHSHIPEEVVVRGELDSRFDWALRSLQPAQRELVELCDLHDCTYDEAAARQGCPIGTVRSRLHRAHAALGRFLMSYPEEAW